MWTAPLAVATRGHTPNTHVVEVITTQHTLISSPVASGEGGPLSSTICMHIAKQKLIQVYIMTAKNAQIIVHLNLTVFI